MNQPHYKVMYLAANEMVHNQLQKNDKLKDSLHATVVALIITIIFAGGCVYKWVRIQQEYATLAKEAQNPQNYMVWQMDSSCFAQLKSANMIQLKIND